MQIEEQEKLDFEDVLIRPKRSALTTRSEVDVTRTLTFMHSSAKWEGVPIIAANMDTIGTIDMAYAMAQKNCLTAIHKHYNNVELRKFFVRNSHSNSQKAFYSIGMNDYDFEKLEDFCNGREMNIPRMVCIDVANGYTAAFVNYVKRVRELCPDSIIMAGNVVTAEMTQELLLAGADLVKIGIGPGCFAPGQQVLTVEGLKNIENIQTGDQVLAHSGKYRTVLNTFVFEDKKELINVNGIKATPNHEFYVLHKKYKDMVDESNIEQYAEWVAAKDLTKEYLLLKY